jgi:hypothetical protein
MCLTMRVAAGEYTGNENRRGSGGGVSWAIITMATSEEGVLKVILLGDSAVGKSKYAPFPRFCGCLSSPRQLPGSQG